MGFFAGLSQGFKPAEIVNLAVGLLEERYKEEKKRQEEEKKKQEERKSIEAAVNAFSQYMGGDKQNVQEFLAKLGETNASSPIIQSLINAGLQQYNILQNQIKEEKKQKEERINKKTQHIGLVQTGKGYFAVQTTRGDNGLLTYKTVPLTDVNGNQIKPVPRDKPKNFEGEKKDFDKVISEGLQIFSQNEIVPEVRDQILIKLFQNSYMFFERYPQYKKVLDDPNINAFVEKYKKFATARISTVNIKDIQSFVNQYKNLQERSIATYAIVHKILESGLSVGGTEALTIKPK